MATVPEGTDAGSRPLGAGREWRTARQALRIVFSWTLLRRTVVIALVVGTILSLVNQAHVIAGGDADGATWARVGANFVIPFIVSSVGALSATHR